MFYIKEIQNRRHDYPSTSPTKKTPFRMGTTIVIHKVPIVNCGDFTLNDTNKKYLILTWSFRFSIFQWRPQAIVFEIVTDKKFDMIIMLFIGLNMLTMTLDHYQQTQTFSDVLDYLNMIFIVIFTSECLMKIFALRYHYFKEPWNLFDFVVVILSILGNVM